MAREFYGANEALLCVTTPISGPPVTMACWFRATRITSSEALIFMGSNAAHWASNILEIRGDLGGDPVAARTHDGIFFNHAQTTTGFSANTWHHACAVFAATNDRRVYIDGGSKGTDNVDRVITNQRISLGLAWAGAGVGQSLAGRIAEAGIWNSALTDAEVAILAAGYAPPFIKPQNLATYWPLIRDQDYDLVGNYDMMPANGPGISAHTRIIYPTAPLGPFEGGPLASVPHNPLAMTGLSGLGGIIRQTV